MTVGTGIERVGEPPAVRQEGVRGEPWRRPLGVVLVVLWATWLVLTAMNQLRFVEPDRFQDDLAEGRIATWRVITVDTGIDESGPWAASVNYGIPAAGESGDPIADRLGEVGGRPALAYIVDSPLARWRVVDPDSGLEPSVASATLRDAGIPPGFAVRDPALTDPPSDVAMFVVLPLATLLLVTFVLVQPTRGTRWFWLWFGWVSLGVGVLAYAVAELLRPAAPPEGPDETPRARGWHGLVLAILLSTVVSVGARWLGASSGWLWVPTP